jgi:hypothetical protein
VFGPTYPLLKVPHSFPSTKGPLPQYRVAAGLVLLDTAAAYRAFAVALQLAAAALHAGEKAGLTVALPTCMPQRGLLRFHVGVCWADSGVSPSSDNFWRISKCRRVKGAKEELTKKHGLLGVISAKSQ